MTIAHHHFKPDDYNNPEAVLKVFWVTLWLNLLVAFSKLALGFITGMLSLVADGFHSVLDASANVVGIVAVKIGQKPPDKDHPYGHRKFEAIGAIIISFLLFLASWEVLKEAWHRFYDGQPLHLVVSPISYGVVVFSMLVSFGVSRYESYKGKLLKSDLLLADSAHTMSDVYNSLSLLIALWAVQQGWLWADLVMSVIIVGLIFKTGLEIIQHHIGPLVDEAVMDTKEIAEAVLKVPGVKRCHHIRSRGLAQQAFVDLHIIVDGSLTVKEAHTIADEVEARLYKLEDPNIVDVVVHVEDDDHEEAHLK